MNEVLNEVLNSGRTEMEIKVIKKILYSPRIKQKRISGRCRCFCKYCSTDYKKISERRKDSSYEWKTEWVLESLVECLLSWMMEL